MTSNFLNWNAFGLRSRCTTGNNYWAPSSNRVYSSIEDPIGLAFDTNISNITITGDFNLDAFKQASYRKINDLCQHFSLEQIITQPNHHTENSITDLFLMSNNNRVLLSGVGEPFLDQNIRYHCPIVFIILIRL